MDNPFVFFNIKPAVFINVEQLDQMYYKLQKQIHPDTNTDPFHSNAALALSSKITKAYNDLKNPIFCIEEILMLNGTSSLENLSNMPHFKDLLMTVFELQEQSLNADRVQFIKELEDRLDQISKYIDDSFTLNDTYILERNALLFSYVYKLLKRLEDEETDKLIAFN
ncbi:MAG: hypothetical protein KBD31_00675 [Proteobacteria bacterium]|nr:hypothetical protein [Pseudomonadota bacterium]